MEHTVIKVLQCRKFEGRTDTRSPQSSSLSMFRNPTFGDPIEQRSHTLRHISRLGAVNINLRERFLLTAEISQIVRTWGAVDYTF